MFDHLKDNFYNIPKFIISAIITLIILEYTQKSLKQRFLTRFYKKLLNMPNITYMVNKIIKPKHKDLAILTPENIIVGTISKTIIKKQVVYSINC